MDYYDNCKELSDNEKVVEWKFFFFIKNESKSPLVLIQKLNVRRRRFHSLIILLETFD